MKTYLINLFAFVVISCIIFLVFYLLTDSSLHGAILMGIILTLMFVSISAGKREMNLDKKNELNVFIFLSILSIMAIITVGIIFRYELIRIILACVVLPIMAFGSYWANKRFLSKKK